jgi:hypothetical protein
MYSELRKLFRQALNENQDLNAMAQKLATELSTERKVMLGVQLYDLISKAGMEKSQVVTFYSFMTQLGMAAQAIDIVYQLNAAEDSDKGIYQQGQSPLESLTFGASASADVKLKGWKETTAWSRFRYHDLIPAQEPELEVHRRPRASARDRELFAACMRASASSSASRCLTYQDLAFYFNAPRRTSRSRRFT